MKTMHSIATVAAAALLATAAGMAWPAPRPAAEDNAPAATRNETRGERARFGHAGDRDAPRAERGNFAPEDGQGFGPRMGRGEGPGPGGPGGPGIGLPGMDRLERHAKFWEDDEIVAELGLEESQVQLLADSFAELEASLESSEGSIRAAADAVREAMDVDSPDIAAVDAALDNLSAATNAKAKAFAAHRVVVKNILTEEQEETLRDFRHSRVREAVTEARAAAKAFRETVRELASDGSLSEADWQRLNTELEGLEPRLRERIEARLDLFQDRQNGEFPGRDESQFQGRGRGNRPGGPEGAPRGGRGPMSDGPGGPPEADEMGEF